MRAAGGVQGGMASLASGSACPAACARHGRGDAPVRPGVVALRLPAEARALSLGARRGPCGGPLPGLGADQRASRVGRGPRAAGASPEAGQEGAGGSPLNVVITGSSKGIGLALAREFLRAGDRVVVTSRDAERVAAATEALQAEAGGAPRVWGTPCDVSDARSVAALGEFAKATLGRVDVWICNAGTNAYFYGPLVDCDAEDLREIVATNLLGVMLCCRQAILVMRDQPGGGHIFNMDGAGADGNATPRFAAYGATKRSLAQLTKSLQAELKMMQVPNVTVHNLSPGMVTTELLMSGANTPQAKFFINALAEPAEHVAQFLVPRVREVAAAPAPASSYIRFLTKPKAFAQILQRAIFQARKGRYVPE